MHGITPAVLIAAIVLIGFLCQWLAWRIKLPAILFLLLAGIAFGPLSGALDPDALLGELLFPVVSLSVAIILFEGSLTLHFSEIRDLNAIVRRLVSIGALLTWILTAAVSKVLFGLDWSIAFLLGSLLVVTGPTVIVPMLRTVRPTARIGNVLRWEGIVIDPIGALLAVVAYEYIISAQSGTRALENSLLVFFEIIVIGTSLGLAAAQLLGFLLRKHWLPEFLQNFATIALVLGTFSFSNQLEHESGLLAVTVMGIYLANMRNIHVDHILSFKENLTVLLISGLFILLAARLEFSQLQAVGWAALILLLLMQFVIRPLMVFLCGYGTDLNWREKAMISWIGPRGIVAAAISGLFALQLEQRGSADGEILVAVTFFIIIGTVVLQSATAGMVASWLGVVEPAPRGALIIGANPVARAIGEALHKNGFTVLLADPSWENIREARLMGLPTFYGNPISEHADRNLDLVGIGRLIAVSPRREDNVLASMRYRHEFGRENIYAVQTKAEASSAGKSTAISGSYKGEFIGAENFTFTKAMQWVRQGARISSTQISEEYSFDDFITQNAGSVIPLFAIDKRRKLHVYTELHPPSPKPGWQIVSLYRESTESKAESKAEKKAEIEAKKAENKQDSRKDNKPT